MNQQETKRGLLALGLACVLWGLQPLYWGLETELDSFFIMGSRAVLAGAFSVLLLKGQGLLGELRASMKTWNVMKRELPAALFLFGDWIIYLWAVQHGYVMECSLGYYIQPLVAFAFGALLFHEPLQTIHFVALGFVAAGVTCSAGGFGSHAFITVSLAVLFAVYAAIKKSLRITGTVSTTIEILLMCPFMLAYLLFLRRDTIAAMTLRQWLFLVGGGAVTAAPMLLYAEGIKRVRMTTVAVCGYISPTLGIACGLLMGESVTGARLLSFALVWIGVLIYAVFQLRLARLHSGTQTAK